MDRIATHGRESNFRNFNLFHMQFPACFVGLNFCNWRNQFQLCFSPTVDDLLLHSPRELLLQGEDKRDWGVWEEKLGAGCIAGQPWCTLLPFCIFLWACILFILFQRREGLFAKPWVKNLSSRFCQVTKPDRLREEAIFFTQIANSSVDTSLCRIAGRHNSHLIRN